MSHNRKKTPIRQELGHQIRMRRKAMGLTQEELAEKSSLHPNYIGSIERGERNVGIENVVVLAKCLNCEAADLIKSLNQYL